MQLRLFILSLAVFSCALPPALGSLHVLKAAAAVGAAKGAALLGAGALALKGAAIKGAVKVAAAKGAAILAAKGLAAKAASLAEHKLPLVQPLLVQNNVPVIQEEPILVEQPSVEYTVPVSTVPIRAPRLPSILGSLSSLWSSAHNNAVAVSSALQTLQEPIVADIGAPLVYPYAFPSRFYPAPLPVLQTIDDNCA